MTLRSTALCIDYFDTLASHRDRPPRLGELLGMPDAFEEVWREWGDRRMTEDLPFETLLDELFRRAGSRPDDALVADVVAERARRQARLLLEPDDAILTMLSDCRELGLRIAVVSNAAVEDLRAWPDSPLAPLVDVTAFSWEVGAVKPDPRIYRAALERLGSWEVADAVFVSDSVADLEGAVGVGFGGAVHATWFTPDARPGAFPVVDDPARLAEVVGQL